VLLANLETAAFPPLRAFADHLGVAASAETSQPCIVGEIFVGDQRIGRGKLSVKAIRAAVGRVIEHDGSLGVVKTRPKGPETGADQPVSGNDSLRLTHILIFGKLVLLRNEISRLRAGQHGPRPGGFSVSGVGVPFRTG